MTRRYFVPDLPLDGAPIPLSDAEAQHAIRVMRAQIGESVTLFDGEGHESKAEIVEIKRNRCVVHAGPRESVSREPAIAVDLAIAFPKPDRSRELIERLTELGVRSVTPLIAARTQRPPSPSLLEKLARGVIEACKQSGRNHLMQIRPTSSASDYFREVEVGVRLIAHPDPHAKRLSQFLDGPISAAIGPEGGWTDEEIRLAKEAGFQAIDLGQRIYRIETAAVTIAGALVSR